MLGLQVNEKGLKPAFSAHCFEPGDGYLRTPEIVARERSIRPFTHRNRDAESMQFAESNGVSTDSDVLDFDRPVQGEVDFYRNQRLDCQIIAQLVDQVPEPSKTVKVTSGCRRIFLVIPERE